MINGFCSHHRKNVTLKKCKTLCLISGRNLGDITISSIYFRQLVESNCADHYLVWTRPSTSFLFEDLYNCKIITSDFPVGTTRGKLFFSIFSMIKAAILVRREKVTWSIDYVGDFRERIFARLAGSSRHFFIGWAPNHAHNQIIRNPFGVGLALTLTPVNVPNVYDAYQQFNNRLLNLSGISNILPTPVNVLPIKSHPITIGLHPFASQVCREWPASSWAFLAKKLLEAGLKVIAFGAPGQYSSLEIIFAGISDRIKFITKPLPDFARELKQVDILVGLDSFSVHMAEKLGVNSVFINGSNDPMLFSPPHSVVVKSSGQCIAWPCYNKPKCIGTKYEYVCIRSIEAKDVYNIIIGKLNHS